MKLPKDNQKAKRNDRIEKIRTTNENRKKIAEKVKKDQQEKYRQEQERDRQEQLEIAAAMEAEQYL